jgi:hypothetical protein
VALAARIERVRVTQQISGEQLQLADDVGIGWGVIANLVGLAGAAQDHVGVRQHLERDVEAQIGTAAGEFAGLR